MKKNLLGILAVVSAIVFSSYTAPKVASVYFHYIPSYGAEYLYESSSSWSVAASHPECTGPEDYVCILRINELRLYPYSGTQSQKLASYLMDQGAGSSDYTSATDAVIILTYTMKP